MAEEKKPQERVVWEKFRHERNDEGKVVRTTYVQTIGHVAPYPDDHEHAGKMRAWSSHVEYELDPNMVQPGEEAEDDGEETGDDG